MPMKSRATGSSCSPNARATISCSRSATAGPALRRRCCCSSESPISRAKAAPAAGSACSWWSTWCASWAAASPPKTTGSAAPPSASRCRSQRSRSEAALTPDRSLIVVEDDAGFARTLKRSFERRGYEVVLAASIEEVRRVLEERSFGYAVVDLKLGGASGLTCVELLHAHDDEMLIVVLTGFASISTAVEAIKLGACHYLAKPSNTDDIEAAFNKAEGNAEVALDARPTSIKTLEWERIHQTLIETDFNISEAARRLGMHRRTLARKLEKDR